MTKPLGKLAVHASSERQDHTTPLDFFRRLDEQFGFTLDAAASAENHLCDKFFTIENSCLDQRWSGERVFLNPPYGRSLPMFVRKACLETSLDDESACELVVMLIPARPDTRYWHSYILASDNEVGRARKNPDILFLKGRLRFSGAKTSAPFPSALIIYRKGHGLHREEAQRELHGDNRTEDV